MAVLKLSTMWCLDDLRSRAVNEAHQAVNELSFADKIALAQKYAVSL
jgi:hypothetical protein